MVLQTCDGMRADGGPVRWMAMRGLGCDSFHGGEAWIVFGARRIWVGIRGAWEERLGNGWSCASSAMGFLRAGLLRGVDSSEGMCFLLWQ